VVAGDYFYIKEVSPVEIAHVFVLCLFVAHKESGMFESDEVLCEDCQRKHSMRPSGEKRCRSRERCVGSDGMTLFRGDQYCLNCAKKFGVCAFCGEKLHTEENVSALCVA